MTISQTTFAARAASVDAYVSAVLDNLPSGKLRLLDLGCGDGAAAERIWQRRTGAEVVGIDFSEKNIVLARQLRGPTFICGDYLNAQFEPFDAIISDSVLQLISSSDTELVAKIAKDTISGGIVIAHMPNDRPINLALTWLRKAWSLMPARADSLALIVASRIYHDADKRILADRLIYLRFPPHRVLNARFKSAMSEAGFRLKVETPSASPSFLKLRHSVATWVKI